MPIAKVRKFNAKRRFVDAPTDLRCQWDITLPDGSKAQCGRRHTNGNLCTQHAKMHARPFCEYCGGNDELPPDHCADCTRPGNETAAAEEAAYWAYNKAAP